MHNKYVNMQIIAYFDMQPVNMQINIYTIFPSWKTLILPILYIGLKWDNFIILKNV